MILSNVRSDIDAVVIATPDHWHTIMAIDACKAGKDIYLEKPITFTLKESLAVVKAVRDNNVILAVGSQQRSDHNFQHAVNMVRESSIGELKTINAFVGPAPAPYNLPEEVVPADLDWEQWLGPNQYVPYNSRLNPPVSLDPPENEKYWAEWRYFKETGGGFTCDWGAHNFDIGQWALDKDRGGPVKIIPAGFEGTEYLTYVYDNDQQSETELVVPQQTVVGTGVLMILLIALLVFFALRHNKWHAWQDEITNWWADFSVAQTMSEAQSVGPQLDERLVV